MSLLTEEQVLDLTAAILDTNGIIYWRVKKWNEKQPTRPALPLDWNLAPKWADRATVSVTWDGVGLTDTVVLSRTKRPVTPHQHAEMMVKYAEVAARRDDPWEEFEWTYKICVDDWQRLTDHPAWNDNTNYRHIGETK